MTILTAAQIQFWTKQAEKNLDWFEPWTAVYQGDFAKGQNQWFVNGKLNACYNCVDRHLHTRANQVAFYWQGDHPESPHAKQSYTYQQLYGAVLQFATLLKQLKIQKSEVVCIYLPLIPEAIIAMLACARIGALHSVIFSGFSGHSLCDRIQDAQAVCLITTPQFQRAGKTIDLQSPIEQARTQCPSLKNIILIPDPHAPSLKDGDHTPTTPTATPSPLHILYYSDFIRYHPIETLAPIPPLPMDAEDPLFILYTSGSTGKPKGVLHTYGGYLVHATTSFALLFDLNPDRSNAPPIHDIFFSTADPGWITGHTYGVYGPLACGITSVFLGGTPHYPSYRRIWEMIDEYQVSLFYTAPTLIRTLMREGIEHLKTTSRQSLRVLGSVGEPINLAAWQWYSQIVGRNHCKIIDTWWQTETGGAMLSPLPSRADPQDYGQSKPLMEIGLGLLDPEGQLQQGAAEGALVITSPWPGMIRDVYQHSERLYQTYFAPYPGYFYTGDRARRDQYGYYTILGRMDDVINVSGHRLSTAEMENILTQHPDVAEAAVVGVTDELTGQRPCAFIILNPGILLSTALEATLADKIREHIGSLAQLKTFYCVPVLPKTRSGKIMRRILKSIAEAQWDPQDPHVDLSPLVNPEAIDLILEAISGR
jgi:acetyl-CoA synthetase